VTYEGSDDDGMIRELLRGSLEHQRDFRGLLDLCANYLNPHDDPLSALKCAQGTLRLRPNSHVALTLVAFLLHTLGNNDDALISIEQSLEYEPGEEFALLTKGRILHAEGRLSDAIDSLHLIPKGSSFTGQGLLLKGIIQSSMGDKQGAVDTLHEASSLMPESSEAIFRIGMAHISLRNFSEAERVFVKALRINPDNPNIHSGRGIALTGVGKYEESIISFEKVLSTSR
jgi:tetratricopeptide (TPR) repeat protein